MWYVEDKFRVRLGGFVFIDTPDLVVYKGKSLFTVTRSDSDGLLGIDFDIFDKKAKRIATVRRGVIVEGNEDDYSIYRGMDRYTVTEKRTGRVICDIRKRSEATDVELDISVQLYTPTGFLFDATPERTNIETLSFSNVEIMNARAGIVIE